MDDSPPDDFRLRDAEAQMRRALGLDQNSAPAPERTQPAPSPADHFAHRRKFVRDGQVPVTVIRPSSGEGKDQLEAARNAMRSLAAAKERAERLLAEAQTAVTHLQTKLGHERLARDEASARADTDRGSFEQSLQSVRADLAAERSARERAEQGLRDAQATISGLTEKLHHARQPVAVPPPEPAAEVEVEKVRRPVGRPRKHPVVEAAAKPATEQRVKPAREPREKPVREPRARRSGDKPVRWW